MRAPSIAEASSSRRALLEFLRRAARLLLPVEIDLGPSQARLYSYLDSVRGSGAKAALHLSPLATTALPSAFYRWIQIRPRGCGGGWLLSAPGIEPRGRNAALVALEKARLDTSSQAMDADLKPASDPLVLVVPGGMDDEKAYVFPVTRIGDDACAIEATKPFEPGTGLRHVEIVGDKRLLREASAQVVQTVPCFTPEGAPLFHCRLVLGPSRIRDSNELYDLVNEPQRVRRLMTLIGLMRPVGWYEGRPGNRGALRFLEVSQDQAVLDLVQPARLEEGLPTRLAIGFELFSVHYDMAVRALERQGDRLRVALPLVVRCRRHHRRADRVEVDGGDDVRLRFRNPATGAVSERSLLDLSFVGLSFGMQEDEDVIWESLPLENTEIAWRGERIALGDIETRAVRQRNGGRTCHAAVVRPGIAEDPVMIDLIARLGHPEVKVHDGRDFSSMVSIYMRAGLFAPFMHRNLEPVTREAQRVWTDLHTRAPDIIRTLVHGDPLAPDAAVTALRAWERTWMAQHFVDVGGMSGGAAGKLQLAYVDHVMPRPDGHFLLFFVKGDNRRMNSFYERFFASSGTSETVTRTTVELWTHSGDAPPPSAPVADRFQVRSCARRDELLVSRAARRSLGDLPAAALSMLPGELGLPDTAARFARAGRERARSCRLLLASRQPLYALIEEVTPPGLNLTWMLNASWILPVHPHLDDDGQGIRAALASLFDHPAQSPVGDRFVIVPEGAFGPPLLEAGFEKLAGVFLYVLNRAGVHRYYYYTANRYGEIGARVGRRRARVSLRTENGD